MPDHETFRLTVSAELGLVPAEARLKQWLKIGRRRFGLVCVSEASAPDPCAWVGWRREVGGSGWYISCVAATEALCREMLGEDGAVLKRGIVAEALLLRMREAEATFLDFSEDYE